MAPTSTAVFRAVADFASLNRAVRGTRKEIQQLQAQAGQTGGWDKFDTALKKTAASQAKLRTETDQLAASQAKLGKGTSGLSSLEKSLTSLATAQDKASKSGDGLAASQGKQVGVAAQLRGEMTTLGQSIRSVTSAEDAAIKRAQDHAKALGDERNAASSKTNVLNKLADKLHKTAARDRDAASSADQHAQALDRESSAADRAGASMAPLGSSIRDAGVAAKTAATNHDLFQSSINRLTSAASSSNSALRGHASSTREVASAASGAVRDQDSLSRAIGGVGSSAQSAQSSTRGFADSARRVGADASSGESGARRLGAALRDAGSGGRQGSAGMGLLGATLNPLKSSMRMAGEAGQGLKIILLGLAVPTVVAAIQLLGGALSSLVGGLTAVVAAAGPAVGALAALAPAALLAAGALGTVMVSFRGVGDALKAMTKLEQESATGSNAAAKARVAAAKAIGAAQRGVRDAVESQAAAEQQSARSIADALRNLDRARRDANDAAIEGSRRVVDAKKDLARAERDAADAAVAAADRVEDAQEDLVRSQERVLRAEQDLHAARRQAIRDLDDLAERTTDNVLSLEGAEIRLLRALERQREVNADATASMLDRREAALAVAEAQDNLSDVQRQSKRDTEALNEAQRAGVNGMPGVVSAQDSLTQAQRAQQDAAESLGEAQRAQARSQQDSAERVADAVESVALAQQASARAQADANERVTDAERNLTEAREDAAKRQRDATQRVEDALLRLSEAQAAATESTGELSAASRDLAAALEKLSPKGRELVELLFSMRGKLNELSQAGQEAMFPGLIQAIKILAPMIDSVLIPSITAIGRVLGETSVRFAEEISSWEDDLKQFGTGEGPILLDNFGTILINLASAMQDVGVAAVPLLQWLALLGVRLSEYWATEAESSRKDGSLKTYFEDVRRVLELLGDIIYNLGGQLRSLFQAAAPHGEELLRKFEELTRRTREWMNTPEGRDRLNEYFDKTSENAEKVLGLLGDIGLAFLKMGESEALGAMLDAINVDLKPSLTRFFEALGKAMEDNGPAIIALLSDILDIFTKLMEGDGGGFSAFIAVIQSFVDVLGAILAVPGIADLAGILLAIAGGLLAIKAVGKITGLNKVAGALNRMGGGAAARADRAATGGRGTAGAPSSTVGGFMGGLRGGTAPAQTATARAGQAMGAATRRGAGFIASPWTREGRRGTLAPPTTGPAIGPSARNTPPPAAPPPAPRAGGGGYPLPTGPRPTPPPTPRPGGGGYPLPPVRPAPLAGAGVAPRPVPMGPYGPTSPAPRPVAPARPTASPAAAPRPYLAPAPFSGRPSPTPSPFAPAPAAAPRPSITPPPAGPRSTVPFGFGSANRPAPAPAAAPRPATTPPGRIVLGAGQSVPITGPNAGRVTGPGTAQPPTSQARTGAVAPPAFRPPPQVSNLAGAPRPVVLPPAAAPTRITPLPAGAAPARPAPAVPFGFQGARPTVAPAAAPAAAPAPAARPTAPTAAPTPVRIVPTSQPLPVVPTAPAAAPTARPTPAAPGAAPPPAAGSRAGNAMRAVGRGAGAVGGMAAGVGGAVGGGMLGQQLGQKLGGDTGGMVGMMAGSMVGSMAPDALMAGFQKLGPMIDTVKGKISTLASTLSTAVSNAARGAASALGTAVSKAGEVAGSLARVAGGYIKIGAEAAIAGAKSAAAFVGAKAAALGGLIVDLARAAAGYIALGVQATISAGRQLAASAAAGIVRGALAAWTAVQWLLNAAMSANPIGIVVIAIMALIAAIVLAWQNSETFRNIVMAAWEGIKNAALWAWENVLKPAFEQMKVALAAVGAAFVWLWQNAIKPAFDGIVAAAKWLWENALRPIFESIGSFITNVVGPAFTWLYDKIIKPVFELIWTYIQFVWEVIKSIFTGNTEEVRRLWDSMWQQIKALGETVWNAIKAFLDAAWEVLKSAFNAVLTFLQNLWNSFWTTVQTIATTIWNAIKDFLAAAWAALQAAWTALVTFIQNLWQSFWTTIQTIASTVWNAIVAFLDGAWNALKSAWQALVDFVRGLWDGFWNGLKSIAETAWGWIRDGIGGALDAIRNAFRSAVDWIGEQWNRILRIVAEPVNFVIREVYMNGIKAMWDKVAGWLNLPLLPAVNEVRWGQASGGPVPITGDKRRGGHDRRGGGKISGSVHGRDSVPILAQPGEYMLSAKAVRNMGGIGAVDSVHSQAKRGLVHANNRAQYASGGPVTRVGLAGGGAVYKELFNMVRAAIPGTRLTSGLRPGDPGYHGKGMAADLAGPRSMDMAHMLRINKWIAANHGAKSTELIHTQPGAVNLLNGRGHTYGAGTQADHRDHVHWAVSNLNGAGGGAGGEDVGYWENPILAAIRDIVDGTSSLIKGGVGGAVDLLLPGSGVWKDAMKAMPIKMIDDVANWLKSKANELFGYDGGSGVEGAGSADLRQLVQGIAAKYGWGAPPEWAALDRLIYKESSWNPAAQNPKSTAYGLFQFLNGTWAETGIAKTSNPGGQAEAGMRYIRKRYGSPSKALAFHNANNWYATGGLIPGTGSGDTHPAMLTPGEFVIRKSAVDAIGVENLVRLNGAGSGRGLGSASSPDAVQRMALGGVVQRASGPAYQIRRGDTLSGIALAYGTTVSELQRRNGIANANRIYAGSWLNLPTKPTPGASATPGSAVDRHHIQWGDTLTALAKRFGTTVQELQRINNIGDPNKIYAGGWLNVPKASGSKIDAARAIKDRFHFGRPIFEDWTWHGAPSYVGQHNDALLDLYKKTGVVKNQSSESWLNEYINSGGQITPPPAPAPTTPATPTPGAAKNVLDAFAEGIAANTKDTKEFEGNLLTLTRWGHTELALALAKMGMSAGSGEEGGGGLALSREAIKSPAAAARVNAILKDSQTVLGESLEEMIAVMGSLQKKAGQGIREVSTDTKIDTKTIFDVMGKPQAVAEVAKLPAANRDKFLSNLDAYKKGLPFAAGGSVGGSGNRDTVPAMLTPGEFVLRKAAAAKIGMPTLHRLNRADQVPVQALASGGPVLDAADLFSLMPTPKVSSPRVGRAVQERLAAAVAQSGSTTNTKSVVFNEGAVKVMNPAPARSVDSFESVMQKLTWAGAFS